MKKIIIGILFLVMLTISGSIALQSCFSEVYNLQNCDYKYRSITDLKLSDIDLSHGLTLQMIPKVLAVIADNSSSIPLSFTLNIDVQNPNSGAAAFESLLYIIIIDNVRFTSGNIDHAFRVESGETKTLPVDIHLNVSELMKNNNRPAVENMLKNFLGISDTPSKVTVQLKPSFKVGKQKFTSPVYVPVNFTYNGK
jgi:LEA14-like dessication related protein